ncbi:MAG: TOMM precursor leader peptide-binding protein [Pseudomonadota bacterium]
MKYAIRPGFRAVEHRDDVVFLVSEGHRRKFLGRFFAALFRALHKARTLDEIRAEVPADEFHLETSDILEELCELGILMKTPAPHPPRVGLMHHCARTTDSVASALAESGFVVDRSATWQLLLVEDYLAPGIGALIDSAVSEGRVVVPFKPFGATAWFGPQFGEGADAAACWQCLRARLAANRPVERLLAREGKEPNAFLPVHFSTTASLYAAAQFAVVELISALARGQECTNLLRFDLARLKREEHLVYRRPQCASCGTPNLLRERSKCPLALRARPKVFVADGGHRIESPNETYERLKHVVDPITGVVGSLGPLESKTSALRPVFAASHFVCPTPMSPLEEARFEQPSIGKGRTPEQARTSALCEALERVNAQYQGDEPMIRGRYTDLYDDAVPPPAFLLFSDEQYVRGISKPPRDLRLATPRSQAVPRLFEPDTEIDWTPAWSLTQERSRLLPFASVYASAPQPTDEQFCAWDSNGCAAGNCLEEATAQALFELIERDATAVWWYNRLSVPSVDLSAFSDEYFDAVTREYDALGHDLWALDLTHDLGIPVVIALSRERGGERYAAGLGCHLDPRIAVQRAMTELHQVFDPDGEHPALWLASEVCDRSFLHPNRSLRAHGPCDFPNETTDDLRADVETCVRRLAQADLETIVVDYSRPDVPLTTVKVVVPGLRHFWPRFAPGRLYDVPVAMGLRTCALRESELNPLPLMM